jgi:DNA-binding transcriptional ArsR family regulator
MRFRGRISDPDSMPTPEKTATDSALAHHRRELILDALAKGGQRRVTDLAPPFALSPTTVRRDLQVLEEQGRLRRVHGGAVLVDSEIDYPLRAREGQRQTQKQRVGRQAAALIRNGMVVYLDSGMTAMELARRLREGLPDVNQLSIVTHGINLAMELAGHPAYDVHLIGGELYRNGLATVGPVALAGRATAFRSVFHGRARHRPRGRMDPREPVRNAAQACGHRTQPRRMRDRGQHEVGATRFRLDRAVRACLDLGLR